MLRYFFKRHLQPYIEVSKINDMLPKDFSEKLTLEFIKDKNWILVLGGQTVGNGYPGYTDHYNRIFEIITDNREIIRVIVHDPRQNLHRIERTNEKFIGTKVTIEYLQINFRDNDHPNQPLYQETIFREIFSGDMAKKDTPEVIDFGFLLSILERRKSFINLQNHK